MITDFSKPLGDLASEEASRLENEPALIERQKKATQRLLCSPPRESCILCAEELRGQQFLHREIPFLSCAVCGHIQTKALPPSDYPYESDGQGPFARIYPPLNKADFEDRKNRIYRPKLDWILSVLERSGHSKNDLSKMGWLEIGSGSGGFLSSLQDAGIMNFMGFEKDQQLLERSKSVVSPEKVSLSTASVGQIIQLHSSQIICAFFVIEHVENLHELTATLRLIPPGTLFCFSVPMFGLSCLLEQIAANRYARSLDAAIHIQTFTEQSIDFFLSNSGMEKIAKWQFGQDALELRRLLLPLGNQGEHLRPLSNKLASCLDQLQEVIDKAGLCDQVHMIARRSHPS